MQNVNKKNQIINKFNNSLRKQIVQCSKISPQDLNYQMLGQAENHLFEKYKEVRDITDVLGFFKIMEHVPNFSGAALNNFQILSKCLLASPLTAKERVTIIFLTINSNIEAGVLNGKRIVFTEEIVAKYNFKYIDKESLVQFLISSEAEKIIRTPDEELDQKSRLIKKELEDFTSKLPVSAKFIPEKVINAYRLIEERLLEKQDTFNEEDIKIVISELQQLGVDHSLINAAENILLTAFSKRENRLHQANLSEMKIIPQQKAQTLTEKEQNLLVKELRKYFNSYKMKPVQVKNGNNLEYKELTLDEQIYCVSLMLKLGKSEKEITEFLRITNKYRQKDNPISLFNKLYSKLVYYSNNETIKTAINNIISIINQMMFVDDNEYSEWKELLSDTLDDTLASLPQENEYELTLAKKYSQNN